MSSVPPDDLLMRTAIAEAVKALGQTNPNPAVGAVLSSRGEIIATGHHRRAGAAHAEVDCLAKVGHRAPADSTLYVTLEPCSTTGRTPPCTDAIIAAGVKQVVIGAIDPNPRHSGRGIEILTRAGVAVRSGVLADECAALNPAFNKWIRTGRPFVTVKCGMTLDGRLTRQAAEGRWITSAAARRHANRRRALVDAILVGAETIRADNPRLTVRQTPGARQPWRVVVTKSGKLPRSAHLFTDADRDRTLVFRDESLETVLEELGRKEITTVLVEGGSDVIAQFLDGRLVDAVDIYYGSILTGGPVVAFGGVGAPATDAALRLQHPHYERIGHDIFMTGAVST